MPPAPDAPSDPGAPGATPPAIAHRTAFILLGLGGAAVASFGIAAIGSIFTAAFFALVLTICVHPIRTWMQGRGVPRGIATVSVLLAVVLLLGAFAGALFLSFAQFSSLLPSYLPQLQAALTDFGAWLEGLGIGAEQVQRILDSFDPTQVIAFLGGVLGGAAGFVSSAVILLTLLVLMAMDSSYASPLLEGIGRRRPWIAVGVGRFTSGVRRYMAVTTGLGAAQGVVNWIALAIMGIPGAPLWGILSFLCSFIPNIGYFIAIIPPLVFAALVGGWPLVVAVIVVYGLINGIIQSVIQPKVVGDAVSLSQSLTFISVLFWAVVLGPMGALLAVPLTLLVRMLLVDTDPRLNWIRPALGELDQTKLEMRVEDAAAKAERKARKSG
ncbi:AI-2E family transporter [Agromyces larvae]|uniref:AI-2E family transporter n=1 Tax=Agromyces larvae TaxID=2929802 RepID=A0ABY4BWV7_9MICO|nr:AI-2E family transporter [Agromyces larvae]UOE43244.1 AI-2E family transporter [Agromyces larvae]